MRNTLALVDPTNGEVTRVVAENVKMEINEVPESSDFKSNDELAEEWDQKIGQRAPVVIQGSQSNLIKDPEKIHNVVLMNKAGDALVTGSGWLANNMIKGGNALAIKIKNGTRELETSITPAEHPVQISEDTRVALEMFGTATGKVTSAASRSFDRAISAAIKGINFMYEQTKDPEMKDMPPPPTPTPSEPNHAQKLGQSALTAVATVLTSTGVAAGTISASARSALVDIIKKKYGEDAGFVAARTLHATGNIVEMLVYFDARGIARQVVKRGTKQLGGKQPSDDQKQEYASDSDLEYDRRMADSPIDDKAMFEHIEYPTGPPPPLPPRSSQTGKSVDVMGSDYLQSPTSPPPFPPRPARYTLPLEGDQDKVGQPETTTEIEDEPEHQTSTIDLFKMDVDPNGKLEPESELLTPNPVSEKLALTTEPAIVNVAYT
ncbi:hypothetical protein INT44_006381 [Umbelopsis vinacea]|uniref:Senescence domain-containing protein n=1 Tax=Umbelopsis vinacea TaxID=44442 RepID=A0A8H7PS74_9FUNG|nr:hypothetical protein INT44_006381 [Umbelopsis vinacea]